MVMSTRVLNVEDTRPHIPMTYFNTVASSASGSLCVVAFARRWAHTED